MVDGKDGSIKYIFHQPGETQILSSEPTLRLAQSRNPSAEEVETDIIPGAY